MQTSRLCELERLFGVEVGAEQRHQVRVYLEVLARWNQRMNLTSIDRVEEQLRLSFFEAFWAAELFVGEGTRMADVGSGAGFPGVPIKVYRPTVAMTLIEPSGKKAVFLREATRAAGVAVTVFDGRGEEFPGWEQVDLASARALKLSDGLQELLRENGVRLLEFHGREPEVKEKLFGLERRERVPGTENRFVSLWSPLHSG